MQPKKRSAVITGAGSGIGKATAIALAKEGYALYLTDINLLALQTVQTELEKYECPVAIYECDVTDAHQMQQFATEFSQHEVYLDVLCNNAGLGLSCAFDQMKTTDWQKIIDINLWGVINGINAFLPYLKKNLIGAHIINIASMSGLIGLPGMTAYTCSKFAVVGLSESLSNELGPFNIKVTAICPGIINTNIISNSHLISYGGLTDDAVAKYYQRFGAPPSAVAKDIVKTLYSNQVIKMSRPGPLRFLYWCKFISQRIYFFLIRWSSNKLLGVKK